MRIRTIKPEFWTSLKVASLPPMVRLQFVGLWNYADDEGRGVDEPRLIKAALFPLDDDYTADDVEVGMACLAAQLLIARYGYGGLRYFSIVGWPEHQSISKPRPSRFPEPSGNTPGVLLAGREGKGTGNGKEGNGVETAARSVDNNPNQPLETQLHFDRKLELGTPAIVKLNKAYGRTYVLEAMRQVCGSPPADPIAEMYAYVASVASFKAAEAVSA